MARLFVDFAIRVNTANTFRNAFSCYPVTTMPKCLKCGDELPLNEDGGAPVLCDRCAGRATSRARISARTGSLWEYPTTTLLTAINVAVFVGMVLTGAGLLNFNGQSLITWGANLGPLTIGGEYWRLVTAGFIHGGLIHIGFNMWCLWSLGQLSERLFGRWQTFAIYMLAGVGGALLSIARNPQTFEVGASGAIFGIAGALLAGVKFGNLSISAGEKKALTSSMIFFVGINFMLGAGMSGLGGNIDNWCHLGGLITGLLMGLPMGAFAGRHRLYQLATVLVTSVVLAAGGKELVQKEGEHGYAVRVGYAIQEKNYPKAISMLESYISSHPEDYSAYSFLGEIYENLQMKNKAMDTYQRGLKISPDDPTLKQDIKRLQAVDSTQK
jgi:membrane associated rhomboid family serine protease